MPEIEEKGLGNVERKEWPTPPANPETPAIDLLKPKGELHKNVLKYLIDRLEFSENAMSAFQSRWRMNELRYQAYINLPDYEKALKNLNDKGKPPSAVQIVVPHMFATIQTITTFMIHTIAGRRPLWQVGSNKQETATSAQMMETILQYQSDHNRIIKHLHQSFNDGEIYGVSILRNNWAIEKALRTVWKARTFDIGNMSIPLPGAKKQPTREERTVYSGNVASSLDPFQFFPDPRVPMIDVNKRGEFVFWRSYEGRHLLKRLEAVGSLKWTDYSGSLPTRTTGDSADSNRSLISQGQPFPGRQDSTGTLSGRDFVQLDQGTIDIIPRELGIGKSDVPEKWIFTIANKTQIIQAEVFDLDHGMHPVCVAEPYSTGYGFGQASIADYMAPIQDLISWFINSHMHNVRASLNNMWILDPTKVEMQDIKNPGPGKIIRLKRAAFGQDVRQLLQQLPVQDVTRSHIQDIGLITTMADSLSSVSDNLRGIQSAGGRKTATEVRVGSEAGTSRLAAHVKLVSAQQLTDFTEQMSLNTQQFLDEEMFLSVVGQDGLKNPLHISPEHLVGDFHYPVHDGTLPLDRIAMVDVWKEIMQGVAGDPELRAEYSLGKIFEHVAELGGAKNIEQFKKNPGAQAVLSPQDPELIEQEASRGNIVPIQEFSRNTPGINETPADRIGASLIT